MFDKYEELKCCVCKKSFTGRKGTGEIDICPKCLKKQELPVVNEGDDIPDSTNEEMEDGNGGTIDGE